MEFKKVPIKWQNKGEMPPENLQSSGYRTGDKPKCQHHNYLFALFLDLIEDIQTVAGNALDGLLAKSHSHDNKSAIDAITTESISDWNKKVTNNAESVTANRIAVFDGTTGRAIKDGGKTVSQLATLLSPEFTGIPKAPTAADETNNTQIANIEFVQTAIEKSMTKLEIGCYETSFVTEDNNTAVADLSKLEFSNGRQIIWLCFDDRDENSTYYLDLPESARRSNEIKLVVKTTTNGADQNLHLLPRLNGSTIGHVGVTITVSTHLCATITPLIDLNGYTYWFFD
jgi:hypothetical protein